MLSSLGLNIKREDFFYRLDNHIAQLELIKKGLGIGVMQKPLGDKNSSLVPVLPSKLEISMLIWAVMHQDLKSNKWIRLLYQYLIKELETYLA